MKSFQILTFATLSLLAMSCNGGSKKEDNADERFVDKVDSVTGISSLNSYKRSDTLSVDGKQYKYSFEFHAVDSLPHVEYPATGAEYLDNAVDLVINHDDTVILKKSFTKATFKSYVPDKLYKTGGLIGFAYNADRRFNHQNDAFYFIATIGNLDDQEEIAYSLEIKIDTAGGMSITKYEESETEPMSEGMTVDPDEDGV